MVVRDTAVMDVTHEVSLPSHTPVFLTLTCIILPHSAEQRCGTSVMGSKERRETAERHFAHVLLMPSELKV